MSRRKINFANGEIYHIYNRGVEKRNIFVDSVDSERFFKCANLLNVIDPVGNIRNLSKEEQTKEPLVEFIAYAIMPNHYHFLIRQLVDDGITKFMQKFGTAYSGYFNAKHKRSGSLFQGKFKALHVDTNEYLLYVSAYVNLNDKVSRGKASADSDFIFTSWKNYIVESESLIDCEKSIVLDQFKNRREYEKFALSVLETVRESKLLQYELKQDGVL